MNNVNSFTRGLEMKYKKLFLIHLIFYTFQLYSQNRFYVSPTGLNSNNGSFQSPWKTINFAIGQLTAGDTLDIMAGTYYELLNNFIQSGTENQRITIRKYNQDQVVINGNGQWTVIDFHEKDYYTFEGLEVTNGVWSGFNGNNYQHCIIRNCTIYDIGPSSGTAAGLYISSAKDSHEGSSNNIVEYNVIHH
jgi:hypothetical protein